MLSDAIKYNKITQLHSYHFQQCGMTLQVSIHITLKHKTIFANIFRIQGRLDKPFSVEGEAR